MYSHKRPGLAAMILIFQVPDVVAIVLSKCQEYLVPVLRDMKAPIPQVSIRCCFVVEMVREMMEVIHFLGCIWLFAITFDPSHHLGALLHFYKS